MSNIVVPTNIENLGVVEPTDVSNLYSFLNSNFTGSVSASGHYAFPGGLTVQWGSVNAATTGTVVTLPVAYQTAIFASFASQGSTGSAYVGAVNTSLTEITVTNSVGTGATTYWLTLGN